MKIYVASSWKNPYYPEVVTKLREAGYFAGMEKKVVAYLPEKVEPELMYGLFTDISTSIEDTITILQK